MADQSTIYDFGFDKSLNRDIVNSVNSPTVYDNLNDPTQSQSIQFGPIIGGSQNTIFIFDPAKGIWLGNAKFDSAPFRVNMQGDLAANSVTLTGNVTAQSITLTGTLGNSTTGTITDNSNVSCTTGAGTNTDTSVSHGLNSTPKLIIVTCRIEAAGDTTNTVLSAQGSYAGSFGDAGGIVGIKTDTAGTTLKGVANGTDTYSVSGTGSNYHTVKIQITSVGSSTFTFRINGVLTGSGGGLTSTVTKISWIVS